MNLLEQITPNPNYYDHVTLGPVNSVDDFDYVEVEGQLFLPTVIGSEPRFKVTEYQQQRIVYRQMVTGALWKEPEVRNHMVNTIKRAVIQEIMDHQVVTLRATPRMLSDVAL